MIETNELTRKLRTLLHPRAALIAYTQEQDIPSAGENCCFLEVREIDDSGKWAKAIR